MQTICSLLCSDSQMIPRQLMADAVVADQQDEHMQTGHVQSDLRMCERNFYFKLC